MTEEQKQVLKWFYLGKNYNEGVGLFTMFTRNKLMARIFPGREDRYREKLEYELCKSVKLDWKNMPELPEADSGDQNPEDTGKGGKTTGTGDDPENTGEGGETTGTGDDPEAGTGNQNSEGSSEVGNPDPEAGKQTGDQDNEESAIHKIAEASLISAKQIILFTGKIADAASGESETTGQPSKTYPEEIEKILKEHSRLLGVRSDYHKQMGEVPEDNTPESVAKRKELSDIISNCSVQIEKLYAAKEAFFVQGLMPDMELLFPVPAAQKEQKLPDDPEALAKMKKNLQNSIYKSQNQLEYQSDSKKDAPDPMPDGAQRIKLVKRIQANQAIIEKINLKLAQRAD